MDLNVLEDVLKQGEVGTVVATIGTTATGSVDPLPGILELQAKYGFRIHADAAYGGYFILADNLTSETRAAFERLTKLIRLWSIRINTGYNPMAAVVCCSEIPQLADSINMIPRTPILVRMNCI